ncbi:Flp pilus assembly protein ATPase CpaE-like protein [Shewanella halifaxensis HAW-EB4]|uniref:Flp pilus assembly protein ATPase CpaE-like protein n=1 Tax=Shewanella halifaxensis (strain HAW-EB4) TaxID=458817 RepID=B0TVF0_SHEHH|nr:pilus assembly protein CpaE [Shewanella halifaxensis]ABZ76835.1 Flp pilus assembly protein ATPase CpaE-like protein [Shewanella halifaxensis HAW-EB4]
MDKPLELCVSNNNQESPMSFCLAFPVQAIVASCGHQSLSWLSESLNQFENLKWQSASYEDQHLVKDKSNFNLVLLVLPSEEVEAEKALAYAANFDCDIILVGHDTPQNILRLAFQYDVSDFIPSSSQSNELFSSLEKVSNRLVKNADLAPVVAIINGKAGSGASFLSASLADVVSQREGSDLALLDMDLHHGTLAHILGCDAKYSICDVLGTIEDLDEIALKSTMTKNGNLSLLAAKPFELLTLDEEVDFNRIKELIWKYRQFYKQVILDFSRGPEDWNCDLLLNATILIVTQQNIMHLRQTKDLIFQLTKNMGIASEQINLVVNRYNKNSNIKLSDIKEALGISSISTVINDYKLSNECVDLGKPLTEVARKQKIVTDVRFLADKFLPISSEQDKTGTTFWKRLLGN